MPVHKHVALVLLIAFLLAGCGGKSGPSITAAGTGQGKPSGGKNGIPMLPGKLLVTGQTTLDLIVDGRKTTVEKAPNNNSYFEYPVFSPDGSKFAYVLATVPTTAQTQNWGNDIYVANADGSNARLVLQHDHPGALIDSLSWATDGSALIYAYSLTQYDAQGHYTGLVQHIERLSLNDGTRTVLINNAIQPSVSWDGKQLVYVVAPPDDSAAPSLALADIDGSHSRELLPNAKGFDTFFAPHLSPDGKQIVFAAVGGPVSPTPAAGGAGGASGLLDLLTAWLRPSAALADGSPFQVWVANVDGSDLHTLGDLREDLPFPLWSSNGKQIVFLGAAALYTANADGTNLRAIGPGVPHGQIAWYQGPASPSP
jgi:Tol biopolymer transport system component